MGRRDYERLPIEKFGRQLITSGDLDPVYVALSRVGWKEDQLHRWLMAYWCFYHCGLASYASEYSGGSFWKVLQSAAANEIESPVGGRWPRGHERRHARGAQGIKMVQDLLHRYSNEPGRMVEFVSWRDHPYDDHGTLGFEQISDRVKTHTLFGPWIAFKVADMVDRVLGVPVDFDQAHVFMFKDPVKAALMLWRQHQGLSGDAQPRSKGIQDQIIHSVVEHLKGKFSDLKAPPLGDRAVGIQEVETVLCKWKSHMNGHYPLFNDIDEIREGLQGWGQVALEFEAVMPEGSEA